MLDGNILVFAILAFAVFTVFKSVKVVPQGFEYTVERFGKYRRTLAPGLAFIVPYFDRVSNKVNMKERVLDVPSQEVITKDNAVVRVDGIVFYQVLDPVKSSYNVNNLQRATLNLTMTNIRTVLGSMDLDESLSKRDKRAEILTAEGFKQAEILKAEGEKQSAILEADGRLEAARRDAAARVALAKAEASATTVVSDAIAKGDIQAVNYFVATKYVDALTAIGAADNQKIVMLPLEASTLIGSIGGIADIAKSTLSNTEGSRS